MKWSRGVREDPNVDIKPSHSSIIVNQHKRDLNRNAEGRQKKTRREETVALGHHHPWPISFGPFLPLVRLEKTCSLTSHRAAPTRRHSSAIWGVRRGNRETRDSLMKSWLRANEISRSGDWLVRRGDFGLWSWSLDVEEEEFRWTRALVMSRILNLWAASTPELNFIDNRLSARLRSPPAERDKSPQSNKSKKKVLLLVSFHRHRLGPK